jgi:hypothetical protein
MVFRLLAAAAAVALAVLLFSVTPAAAGGGKRSHAYASSHCCKAKKPRAEIRCGKYCSIHEALSAKSARSGHSHGKWHGWVATRKGFAFYLDGARYKGGRPCGPPMAYNNWEGGFNRRVFWILTDRDRY